MPKCAHRLHTESGLPLCLPPQAFYQTTQGTLYWCCRHCAAVYQTLYRAHGTTVWSLPQMRHAWRTYRQRQERAQRKHALEPGERWCPRGHSAHTSHFGAGPYCLDCDAIAFIRSYHRRKGAPITHDEASRRHFHARSTPTRRRNQQAPPGQRWCPRCQAYFVLPPHWQALKHLYRLCPAHQRAYNTARIAAYRARGTTQHFAAAAD